jgi:hypothetical protein
MIPVLVVAALLATAPAADTVYTLDGGRITGTVLEEGPTSGVTIQTPDGSVRRLERSQVARVEFADGTVSTPSPPPPPSAEAAPAPHWPAPATAAAVPEGPADSVYFVGSGRVRGTVMEESAASGVKIRRLDGSIHTYAAAEIARIEYADGTVSTPKPPPAPARPPEPAAAPVAKSADGVDSIYFLGGGRVRGLVIEENPKTGVRVRLLDGSIQTYSRDELLRIEYSDGTVSRRKTPPQPAAPAAAPAPIAPAPVPQPAAVSLGLGATFLHGNAAEDVPMNSFLETEQMHFAGELGLRLSPSFAFGVYGDIGAGDPADAVRDDCELQGLDCVGTTGRFGFLIRHTWAPLSLRPTWISLGTGWEFAGVAVENHDGSGNSHGGDSALYSYRGREYFRLGAGVDFRSNRVVALGLYGSYAVGEYDEFEAPNAAPVSLEQRSHQTVQVGLRLTLFP